MKNHSWGLLVRTILVVSAVGVASAILAADEVKDPEAFLKSKGLVYNRYAKKWVFPQEMVFFRSQSEVVQKVRDFSHARVEFQRMLRQSKSRISELFKLQAQIQRLDQQIKAPVLPARVRRQLRGQKRKLERELQRLERQTWKWVSDRRSGVPELNEAAKQAARARVLALVALQQLEKQHEPLRKLYEPLAEDEQLQKVLREHDLKIGPLRPEEGLTAVAPTVREVLNGPQPLYFEKGTFWTIIAINGEPVEVIVQTISGSQHHLTLPEETALKMGFSPPSAPNHRVMTVWFAGKWLRYSGKRIHPAPQVTLFGKPLEPLEFYCETNEKNLPAPALCISSSGKPKTFLLRDDLLLWVGSMRETFGYSVSRPAGYEPEVYVPLE